MKALFGQGEGWQSARPMNAWHAPRNAR